MILLDVRMAGLDGLRDRPDHPLAPGTRHIPIIFLTAQASDVEEIALAYASGAVDYVIKPFEPEILRAKVAVFVELHRERGERVRESRARAEAEAVARTVRTLQILSDTALAHLDLDEPRERAARSGRRRCFRPIPRRCCCATKMPPACISNRAAAARFRRARTSAWCSARARLASSRMTGGRRCCGAPSSRSCSQSAPTRPMVRRSRACSWFR